MSDSEMSECDVSMSEQVGPPGAAAANLERMASGRIEHGKSDADLLKDAEAVAKAAEGAGGDAPAARLTVTSAAAAAATAAAAASGDAEEWKDDGGADGGGPAAATATAAAPVTDKKKDKKKEKKQAAEKLAPDSSSPQAAEGDAGKEMQAGEVKEKSGCKCVIC